MSEETYTLICEQNGNMITVSGSATNIREVADLLAQFLIGVGFHRDNVKDILDAEYVS